MIHDASLLHLSIFSPISFCCIGVMPLPGGLSPFPNLPNLNVSLPDVSHALPRGVGIQPAGINVFCQACLGSDVKANADILLSYYPMQIRNVL